MDPTSLASALSCESERRRYTSATLAHGGRTVQTAVGNVVSGICFRSGGFALVCRRAGERPSQGEPQMPLYLLMLAVQIGLAVHVAKTGRSLYWIMIIV